MIRKMPPMLIIILSFLVVIFIGSGLLSLPIAYNQDYLAVHNEEYSYCDALFISFSAVCVTGLTPIANFGAFLTTFGKVVAAILIQIGGLGFVTVAIFVLTMMGVKIGPAERYLVSNALNTNTIVGIIKLVRDIIIISFSIEFVGFILNLFVFIPFFPGDTPYAVGVSVFHAISAFNNCGLNIIGLDNGFEDPYFQNNVLFNINTSLLIILGGLGFIVIRDILFNKRWKKLSVHSKMVLKMTILLIVVGAVSLYLSELNNPNYKWHHAIFHSIGCRTAGFSTFDLSTINGVSVLLMMILMFIGASPSSTGGGIKTTTVYTIAKAFISFTFAKPALIKGRVISNEAKTKASLLIIFAMICITIGVGCLLAIEMGVQNIFVRVGVDKESGMTIGMALFEAISAFSTVGYTTGITRHLNDASEMVLCILMFIGRLGPLTIISSWNNKWRINSSDSESIHYLEEKIIIG